MLARYYTKGGAMDSLSHGDFQEKAFMLGTVFNPTAPINRQELFAGRQAQTRDVVDAINQRGQHAVLYGERGVGKTSLSNMIFPRLLSTNAATVIAPQINCMSGDSYGEIWRRVFEEILFNSNGTRKYELDKSAKRVLKEYTGSYADQISPDIVRRVLYSLGQDAIVVVILDEFDSVEGEGTRATISDTLKFLSDRAVPATVVLVGVSDDVESLIANHRSLERCLRQIPMPRMSHKELEVIVEQGLNQVAMTIEKPALRDISKLSRGLPHYVHLLGLHSGRAALDKKKLTVSDEQVQLAIGEAIGKAQSSIQSDYSKAISSSRRDARYKEVLLACALAETDDLGWFYPRHVREPLAKILNRPCKIEAFARHLHAFCEDDHGSVLVSDKRSVRPRFRFDNPLLQPYILIRGLSQQLITKKHLETLKEMHGSGPEVSQGTLWE
jgi:Cdc6-like AAA superfamily ATPase